MSLQGRVAWLKAASAAVIGFGLLIAPAAFPAAADPTAWLTDLVFWPLDGAESLTAPATRLFCAITGGMLVGWGTLLWLLASRLYPREPALARRLILASVGAWFVVDSLGSVAVGAPANAALNVIFLLVFVVPLWRPVRSGAATPA